jgi:voltage-gated potassium channel
MAISKLVGAFTAIMGVCVLALLTGIVATAFANQISKRHDLLEAEIVAALKDGIINEDVMRKITKMQDELAMSEEHTKAMIELLRDRHQSRLKRGKTARNCQGGLTFCAPCRP